MQKSVLKEKGFVIFYIAIWLVYALILFIFLHYYAELALLVSIPDAVVSSALLAVMLLSLWFIIRYSDGENIFSNKILLHSLAGLLILISAWLFIMLNLLGIVFSANEEYQVFLWQSLLVRALFGLLIGAVVFLAFASLNLIRATRDAASRESELKVMVQQTELQALKNQLNPHFIYNSLNSISSLTIVAPQKAQEMVVRLSDFLRYALKQDAMQLSFLHEELQNARLYLQIEQIRFGERLQFDFQVKEEHLNCRLPVMILQPLFENAVKHGIQRSSTPGKVIFSSEEIPNGIKLKIVNCFEPQYTQFRSEGIGLENIRNRLRLIYGNGKLLQIKTKEELFIATLELPQ